MFYTIVKNNWCPKAHNMNFRINLFHLEKVESSVSPWVKKTLKPHISRTRATKPPCEEIKRISSECYLLQRGLSTPLDTAGVKPENTNVALKSLNVPIK